MIEPEAQTAPTGALGTSAKASEISTAHAVDKSKEPRDGTWARWKIASELRWVREKGGPLDAKGGFNPKTWKALLRAKALGVAIGRSKDPSTGATDGCSATYLVVESSMNKTTKHAVIGLDLVTDRARIKLRSASNAVDRVHRLRLWSKQERQGDDGEWTSNLYDFTEAKNVDVLGEELTTVLHALKLITTPRTFDRTVTRKNKETIKKATTSRSPARMVVFVWVFCQIVLKQACAHFTLNELCKGTGLKRRAAKKAIESLLGDGTFVKVGEGAVSLREAVGRPNSIVKRVDGPLWTEETLNRDRPAIGKRKSKSVLETADVRVLQSADGDLSRSADGLPESAHGVFESADGDVFESAYGAPESAQGVPESADILLAESPAVEIPEEIIPPAASACSPVLNVVDSVPLSPTIRSDASSLLSGASMIDIVDRVAAMEGTKPEGKLVTSLATSAARRLVDDVEAWRREVIAAGDDYSEGYRRLAALVPVDELANRISTAVGPAMAEGKRWHRQAVRQWALHKLRKVLLRGADDRWLVRVVDEIGADALDSGRSLSDWNAVSLRFDVELDKLGGTP